MKLRERQKYLRYLRIARHWKGHGIHSPFMFHLQTEIIENKYPYYAFMPLRHLRKKLENSDQPVGNTTLSDILKNEVRPQKQAELLFRLVNHFQPSSILELGTSIGLTTLHLASVSHSSQVITVEPCPDRTEMAQFLFKEVNAKNIDLRNTSYEETLTELLERKETKDFIILNKTLLKEKNPSFISKILNLTYAKSVIIFCGIHASKDAERKWKGIIKDDRVRVSVDLFHLGLLIFNPDLQKQHYTCRFHR